MDQSHISKMNFKCFECSELFSEEVEAISHLKKEHFVKDNKDPIYCLKNNDCKKYYQTFSNLRRHMKSCEIVYVGRQMV